MCRELENIFQLPVFFWTDFNKLVTVPDDHSQSNNIANDGRGIQGDGSCLLIKEWITTQRTTQLGIEEQSFNCRSSVSRQICGKLDSFPDDCPNYNQSTTHKRRIKAGCSFPSQKVCATRYRENKLLVVCQAFLDRFLKIG